MRFKKLLFFIFLTLFAANTGFAQSCVPTNINGTNVNLLCNQVCTTLVFRVPHLKSTDDYAVNTISFQPYAWTTPAGNELTTLYADDEFGPLINLPFPFCFYGANYNSVVVGSNSIITFDATTANQANAYPITQPIPYAGGTPNVTTPAYYPPASIMGGYSDIDPRNSQSPLDKKIEWRIEGSAPCRRFIASYWHVGTFGAGTWTATGTNCNSLNPNNIQIVIYESTGLIDVFIGNKICIPSTNGGNSILGVQNWARNAARWASGKNAVQWTSVNEGYRFTPSGSTSRFVSSQLYDITGTTLIATADSSTTTAGLLDLSFLNICAPAGSTQYIVRTTFASCENPSNLLVSNDTITLNRTNALGATNTVTHTSCGTPNGTITVNIPAGIGISPFSYSLDGGTPVVTPALIYTFTNVAAGNHTVTVTDASSGCSSNLNVTVNLISNITANTATTATACTGVNTGTITVTPTNGSAPYTYQLDGGLPLSGGNPYTFTGLAAGTHTIVVRDASGCVSNTLSVTVATGAGVTASSIATSTSCSGVNDATITVTASTGTAPFMYQLGAGPFQASNVFTGLAPGTYTITVRDNVGCTRTLTRTVFAGTGLTATVAQAATSCNGANDGTVTVTPTNGTSPYQFSIDGGASVSAPASYTFTNLAPGSHTVFITDTRGCTRTSTITVGTGAVLAATAAPASTSCSGAIDGTITVTPTNGTGPFEFSLDGGTYVAGTAPYTFTGLSSGAHTITIRNAAGCVSNVINTSITAGPVITTTASKTDVLCNGGNTGTITVAQPAVGATPFEYSLDGTTWQTSNVFNGLAAGTYTVYYRSANGCQNSLSIIVDQPTTLTSGNSVIPVVCNGLSNGTITITSAGGVSPHQYSIDGTNWQGSNVFNVPAGTYTVTTRDVNGCTNQQVITVTEPATLAATSANSNASCDGGNDGVITVNAVGGNTSYQYSIDGGTTWQSSNVFNVAPGNYTVMVKDNLGCSAQFNTTVGLTNTLTYTRQTDPVICESKSVQLDFVSNATQYAWTPATALSSSTIHNPVANPVVTTEYHVLATLGRCNVEDTVIVNVNLAPIPNAGTDGFICYGQSYQLNAVNGVQYKWTPSTYLDNPNIANPLSTPTKDIIYTLSIISDANGCASLTTDDIAIDVTPPIKIKTYPADTVVYQSDILQISAVPFDPDVIYFNWSPSLGLDNPAIANPTVTAGQIGEDIMYQVIGSTVAGCKGEAYVRVRVYKGPDIYVPTGFTPNGDGLNDKLIPFPVGIKQLNYFRVFNRWGQQIFSTSKLHDGWDGTINGTRQASGTYVWMAEAVTEQDKVITKKGVLTLIR